MCRSSWPENADPERANTPAEMGRVRFSVMLAGVAPVPSTAMGITRRAPGLPRGYALTRTFIRRVVIAVLRSATPHQGPDSSELAPRSTLIHARGQRPRTAIGR